MLHFAINAATNEVEVFKAVFVGQSNKQPSHYRITKSNTDLKNRDAFVKVSTQIGNVQSCIEKSSYGQGFRVLTEQEVSEAIREKYGVMRSYWKIKDRYTLRAEDRAFLDIVFTEKNIRIIYLDNDDTKEISRMWSTYFGFYAPLNDRGIGEVITPMLDSVWNAAGERVTAVQKKIMLLHWLYVADRTMSDSDMSEYLFDLMRYSSPALQRFILEVYERVEKAR